MNTSWHISEYTPYARQFARNYTRAQLTQMLAECEAQLKRYTHQHLGAIRKTTSMQSNSPRRANTRNKVGVEYEKVATLRNALEIHEVWPEYSKPDEAGNAK